MYKSTFRVVVVNLESGKSDIIEFGDKNEIIGGSGLAAALYQEYGKFDQPAFSPEQPLIFAIGPLTGLFPLMSKVVCSFKSPYHEQYAESHAGGRLAMAMRFSGYDAMVFIGKARNPSAVCIANRSIQIQDVNYLWGANVFTAGRVLRKSFKGNSGHRSIIRIGPAGETLSNYACINVDTFRHFGRLGCGAVMGSKNLKGIAVMGDGVFSLPEDDKAYSKLFKKVYEDMTGTHMMSKYHDLGTPQNVIPMNELRALPWRNLQQTTDPAAEQISGERFASELLMRNTACSGCPVGCIHLGMLREQFQDEHRFQFRQVTYDHEPIFAMGSMIGVTSASDVLALLDDADKQGLDCMSAGVALAWATEALQKGIVTEEQTLYPLEFGNVDAYRKAIWNIGHGKGEFYENLARGAMHAAKVYGGEDFACVLGQEMAGYATGEVYFVSQALGFRHSHLDSGGYSYDQKHEDKDIEKARDFMVSDEQGRCLLTSLVSCLFARGVYKDELVSECLESVGLKDLAANIDGASKTVQKLRWKTRIQTGYDPAAVSIPKRFYEVETWKGKQDPAFMNGLKDAYAQAIVELGKE